ncbi:MAG: hypothetical protein C4547_01955 [Phycisphaerales bacterium]|nr:MAG: hypothetical protein C4547_01955 [Phycisphaerales bacterium]
MTLFAVLAAGPFDAVAIAATGDVEERIREIYVPLEEFTRIVQEQGECVLLSRDEYESLLQAAAPQDPEQPAPRAAAVISADYSITLGRDRATINGHLILDVLEPGLRAVALDVAHVGVRGAQLDGVPAPLARSGSDGLTLFVEGLGRHELTLDMTAPVETSAAQQTLRFRLPDPAALRMSIVVAGDVEIKSGAAVVSRVFDEAAQVTRFEVLPQPGHAGGAQREGRRSSRIDPSPEAGAVTLVMTLNNRLLQAQRAVTARGVIVDEITASYERLHATFLMTVLHQAVDEFRFSVPGGFEVTDVTSPLLSRWAVVAAPSGSVLDVRLRESAADSVVVGISAIKTGGDPAAWTLPPLAPLDVVAEAAVVALLLEDRLTLQALTTDKLIPIDAGVITEALSAMMFGGEPGAPRLRAVAAFYSPMGSEGFDATGVFRQPAGRLNVTTSLLLTLSEKELRVQGGFALNPAAEPLFAAEIEVPDGWHVLSVTDADGAAVPFETLDATDAGANRSARVRVAFPGGIAPGTQRSIYFQAVHTPAGWLSAWQSAQVTFPAFAIRGADREAGAIAVDSGDEMIAYPESVEGLTPLDDADKAEYGLSAVTGSWQAPAFRFERQERPFHATFRIERVAPRLTAKAYSFLHLAPHLLSTHYEVVFDVERAKTNAVSLSLPAGMPADVSITGVDGATVKEYASALVGDRRHWTVHLTQARRETVRLAIEFDQPLDASQAAELALPMVRAEAVAYQSGVVAVESSAEVDLETKTALRRVDVGELAGAVYQPRRGAAGGLDVFAYVGDDPAVAVTVARRTPYGLPTAIVQRAEMVTQVCAQGAAQTAVRLMLRTSAAFLEVDLPAASELWSATIDGKPLQPQREADRLLLSLPAQDRLLDVRIIYQTQAAPVTTWGEVALASPRFAVRAEGDGAKAIDVPSADLRWNVHLSTGFRLAGYEGTANTAQLPTPEPAAWSVARLLWRATGGIHLFYHDWWMPRLSRARELALPNMRGLYSLGTPSAAEPVQRREEAVEFEDARKDRQPPPPAAEGPDAREKAAPAEADGRAGIAPQFVPSPPSSARSFWALEGVRSLTIDLAPTGPGVTFTSLGADPHLQLTLANDRRITALGWGSAWVAGLIGLLLTPRPVRTRALYVAAVALAATVVPILFGNSELIRVANPVFYAVMLLVPFYVGVRLVRWIVAVAGRPVRLRAATATMLIVAGVPSAMGEPPSERGTREDPVVVEVSEPLPPIELPDDAVLVPYDPAAALGPDGAPRPGREVLLPYALFQALWSAAHPAATGDASSLPAPFALAGGAFTATLGDGDDLDIQGHLEIVVYADGVVAIPLTLAGAVLSRVTLDGQPAQLGAPAAERAGASSDSSDASRESADTPFVLLVKGQGPHRLDLAARIRITRQGGWRVASGRIPSAPGTAFTLHVPDAGTEIRLDGLHDRRSYESQRPGETIATALGPDGGVNLRWRPRVFEGGGDASITAASEAVLDVREDGVRLVWRLTLDCGRGEPDAFRLTVPRDYLVHSISGPNVRGWNRSEADASEVSVLLLQPGKGTQSLTVVLHRRADLSSAAAVEFDAPAVHVVGAALQNGRLIIRRSALLDLAAVSTSGVTRIDTPGDAEKLIARAPDATASPLGTVVYQSYQFAAVPFVCRFSAKAAASDWYAQLQSVLRISERRRTLETRVTVTPRRQPVHRVQIGVPADLEVESVETSGTFEWAVSDREGEAARRTLTVRLTTGQSAAFPIILRGTLGEEGPIEEMSLPVIAVIGAKSQHGEIAIQTDPAFDLAVEAIRNCREIPLERTYPWLAEPQRPLARAALSHSGVDYEAQLRITARRPVVTCTTITNVRVTQSTIEETLLLDFDVAQTGIREIVFVLPGSLKDARVSAPMLRHKTVEPLTEGPESAVRLRLTLQDEIMGGVRVLVENDRLLGASAFRAPFAVVETGRTHRRYVAFESAGRDEIEVESQVDVEPLVQGQNEWHMLTNLVGAALTRAYVATGDHPELTLQARPRAMLETTGARIGLARAVLVADAGGAYRATQFYRMENRSEPFLEVVLPPGATLWSVQVAGESVKPAGAAGTAGERRVRVPLIKSAAGELDYEVALKYAGQLPPPGALRTVDFPLLRAANVAVELSQVSLLLPDELRWFDFGGAMRRVDDEAELAAGFVRYQTRQTERLEQTLESDSPFARIRAAASLNEVASATEQIRRVASSFRRSAALDVELESNKAAVGRALVQQQQQELLQQSAQAAQALDNRAKLDVLYDQQHVVRARNQVQELSGNFQPPVPAEGGKEAPAPFDREWLKRNTLEGAAGAAGEAARQIESRLDRDDATAVGQQVVQPPPPQFKQRAVEDTKAAPPGEQAPTRRGGRAAGADELAREYQAQLEQAGAPPVAMPPAPLAGGDTRGGGGQPLALTGLVVDFPLRGSAFHFTTPRGDATVTARAVSRGFLESLSRFGLTLLAVAGFTLVYVLATHFRLREHLGGAGATSVIVLGTLSVLAGILPVVGAFAVIGGLVVRKRVRADRATISGSMM